MTEPSLSLFMLQRSGSQDPQVLSAIVGLAGALIGVVGVFIGAGLTIATTRSAERRKSSIALYDFFTTSEMELVRDQAARVLTQNLKLSPERSFYEMQDLPQQSDLLAVSRLVHFWERVHRFVESGYADDDLTRKLLREYFSGHYKTFLYRFAQTCRGRNDPASYQQWVAAVDALAARWNVPPAA